MRILLFIICLIGIWLWHLIYITFLFALPYAVGRMGVGAAAALVGLGFCASALPYFGCWLLFRGPPTDTNVRDPWGQGLLLVSHAAMLFAAVMWYAWVSGNRLDESLTLSEGWMYWKQYIPTYLKWVSGPLALTALLKTVSVFER